MTATTAGPIAGALEHGIGPATPQPGITAPAHGLGVLDVPADDRLWVLGAHGGAGETTLAVALAGTGTDRRWPRADAPARVLVVARTHLSGLRAAQRAAQQWAAGATPAVALLGLVLLPDAPGRLPRELRDFAQVVAGGFPRSWFLPWEEGLRLAEPKLPGELPVVDAADVPRSFRRLAADLAGIAPAPAQLTDVTTDRLTHSHQEGQP
jgi:hypothetical protein